MLRVIRVVGIAVGLLVAADLAVSLVAGLPYGWGSRDGPPSALVAVVLGGLVFVEIMRREGRGPERTGG